MNDAAGFVDLSGGRDPQTDLMIADAPQDPERLEGVSMWIWDDAGEVGLPRIAVDARGATWTTERMISVNAAMPDGRVYTVRDSHPPHDTTGDDGLPRVLGGGALRLECVEPFQRWQAVYFGEAMASDSVAQMQGATRDDLATVEIAFEIDAVMTVPAWVQGSLDPEGSYVPGEDRFEQLFTATGHLSIDGKDRALTGGGLRIHRKGGGRSDMSTWRGHCWQSAVFPSGRAFGYILHAPYPDGTVRYSEGFVYDDGDVLPARVASCPWMTTMATRGQAVPLVLDTERGSFEIGAETTMSTFVVGGPTGHLQQGLARYTWDGETANGMIERSYPNATFEPG